MRPVKWNRRMILAGVWLALLLTAVMVLPALLGVHPTRLTEEQNAPVSWEHWLGTDGNGRDLLARVCYGARVSLIVGLAGAVVSLVIGVTWGMAAGYLGGRWDGVLMRTVDILYSMPSILFVIVLVSVLQEPVGTTMERFLGGAGREWASVLFLVAGLGGVSWLTMARMVRSQVRSLQSRPFLEAARALGAGHGRLIFRHLMPNTLGVVLVYMTLTIPAIVLGESFLSFLGLGVQPPNASLGTLLADGAGQINPIRTPWALTLGPSAMLVGMLMGLSVMGDGLRDALDPASDR